jgi:RNA polymerase sigma factor (sigma-70 family)
MGTTTNDAQIECERKLKVLFERHYGALMAYANSRYPQRFAEDIISETFLVAWRRIDRVPENPRAWLIAVARNVAATQLRSERRRLSLLQRLSDDSATEPSESEQSDQYEPMIEALASLPEKDREAILLIAWDELSPAEAAEVLGQSAVSFRVRLHRARGRLRRELARSFREPPAAIAFSTKRIESRP